MCSVYIRLEQDSHDQDLVGSGIPDRVSGLFQIDGIFYIMGLRLQVHVLSWHGSDQSWVKTKWRAGRTTK